MDKTQTTSIRVVATNTIAKDWNVAAGDLIAIF